MRQNAVSSAPQNDVATHRLAMNATMPTVVDEPRTSRSALDSVVVGGAGEQLLQVLQHGLRELAARTSTWPATKSAISATGKIDSRRL